MNVSLYTINSFLILDHEGKRLFAKYYQQAEPIQKQFENELKIFNKVNKLNQDILIYQNKLIVYKQINDVIIIIISNLDENESLVYSLLSNVSESLTILLDNTIDKLTILQKFDIVSLCIDEAIDDGIILEMDSSVLVSRVTNPPSNVMAQDINLNKIDLSEKGLFNALSFASKKIGERLQQGL
ncbi:coatomer subunit zeta [[Candida] jaroonii]|uniref:Coatomer subunit zeta n=1 Tax=[Candida] jaroonii TaxID=467808 RepID=A0ACA9YA71_9ASCO|nr:coatomer subunit zeta [[Candida] jaroonii]